MQQVVKALSGHMIDERSFHPIEYKGRLEPVVNSGYVEFQLNFVVHHKF